MLSRRKEKNECSYIIHRFLNPFNHFTHGATNFGGAGCVCFFFALLFFGVGQAVIVCIGTAFAECWMTGHRRPTHSLKQLRVGALTIE